MNKVLVYRKGLDSTTVRGRPLKFIILSLLCTVDCLGRDLGLT